MSLSAASPPSLSPDQRSTAAAESPLPPPTPLCGWGRHPVLLGHERHGEDLEAITRDAVLTRGAGRSYGDASLPPAGERRAVANSTLADRILSFDPETGMVRVEAGLLLRRLHHVFVPRGWFVPVTPGTQLLTIGGMVASDVHGKSHHVDGCFGEHVRELRIRVADGSIVDCSDEREGELFRATLGGMGLTGHVLEVEFRLKRIPSPWIVQLSERLDDIDAVVARLKEASAEWPFTMCWVDCFSSGPALGRGILMSGRWAEPGEVSKPFAELPNLVSVPFSPPAFLPRTWGVKLFNGLYFWMHGARERHSIVHPYRFFYPLDVVRDWNRLYARRGFIQYQCVLPVRAGNPILRRLLEVLQQRGTVPYLNVVKDCGAEGKGMLSFPKPGISFALDIPVSDDLQASVDALNELIIPEGGRIYLTKDSMTRADHFRAMEPRLEEFNRVRRTWDPLGRLKSAQSVRVLGDPP
jgi:FAD/FMN-containing dehydrogenase